MFIETQNYRINLSRVLFVEVDEDGVTVFFTHGTEKFRGEDAIALLDATAEKSPPDVLDAVVFGDDDMVGLDL